MGIKKPAAGLLAAGLLSLALQSGAATTIDFTNATCYGMSTSQVMVQNISVLIPITNPFDPSSTTVLNYSYNVPFTLDSTTLHLVPNVSGATQTGGSGGSVNNCASLDVRVADAYTGYPISGATVTVGSSSATTDSSGVANLSSLTAGSGQVTVSASNYVSASQTVTSLSCSAESTASVALSPQSGTGALTSGEFRAVLTWGENPRDLDSHLTGPQSDGTNRFHAYYLSKTHDVASLDVDDTSSYGPETITVSPPSGSSTLRPGVYRYSVHHYAGSGTIGTSGANVRLTRLTTTTTTTYNYTPSAALTFSGSNDVWTVFELTVDSAGAMYIAPVDSVYSSSASSVRSSGGQLSTGSGYGRPEDLSIFGGKK
jgi:hypothetical protein